jgi:hypothetical protein
MTQGPRVAVIGLDRARPQLVFRDLADEILTSRRSRGLRAPRAGARDLLRASTAGMKEDALIMWVDDVRTARYRDVLRRRLEDVPEGLRP